MCLRKSWKRWYSPSRCPLCSVTLRVNEQARPEHVTQSASDLYEYTALNVLRQEIRVFEIEDVISQSHPANIQATTSSNAQTIRGSLRSVPIYELPAFVALSYNWGDLKDQTTLLVDGKKLSITRSLQVALEHLFRAKVYWIWADAICINQKDLEEKASQIQRLSTIFRAADKVVAWLGVHDEHTQSVFDFIRNYRETKQLGEISTQTAIGLGSALVALSERPYWTRVWILQEFALANRLYVMCGNDVEDANSLRFLLSFFWTNGGEKRFRELTRFHYMWTTRENHRLGASTSLLELLLKTTSVDGSFPCREVRRVFQSTKVLDQIYGLLGLANDGGLFILEPDYSIQCINDLFARMTKFFISGSRQLDVCFLEHGEKAVNFGPSSAVDPASYMPGNLPVWCPDYLNLMFSAQNTELMNSFESNQLTLMRTLGPDHRRSKKSHCWHATANSRLTADSYSLNDNGSMIVQGRLVGTIMSSSDWKHLIRTSSFPADEMDPAPPAWLSELLYSYASRSPVPLMQIVEALRFILSDMECDVPGCCETQRARLKAKLLPSEQTSDDLMPFITKELLRTSSEDASIVPCTDLPPEAVHEACWTIIDSADWNYKYFCRKAMAYTPAEQDALACRVADVSGPYAWVPDSTRVQDEIWLLQGCSMPIVLRRRCEAQPGAMNAVEFTKVGPALVNGAMEGAMWRLTDPLVRIVIDKFEDLAAI